MRAKPNSQFVGEISPFRSLTTERRFECDGLLSPVMTNASDRIIDGAKG